MRRSLRRYIDTNSDYRIIEVSTYGYLGIVVRVPMYCETE